MPDFSLDKTDTRIIQALCKNARISNTELATAVNLAPSSCLRRVQRLEQLGVIEGYTAILNPQKLGLDLLAFVRVHLEKHDTKSIQRFAAAVEKWDEVIACHALTGSMDYLLQVQVADLEHFSQFVLGRLLNATGVADVNSSFVLKTIKQQRFPSFGE